MPREIITLQVGVPSPSSGWSCPAWSDTGSCFALSLDASLPGKHPRKQQNSCSITQAGQCGNQSGYLPHSELSYQHCTAFILTATLRPYLGLPRQSSSRSIRSVGNTVSRRRILVTALPRAWNQQPGTARGVRRRCIHLVVGQGNTNTDLGNAQQPVLLGSSSSSGIQPPRRQEGRLLLPSRRRSLHPEGHSCRLGAKGALSEPPAPADEDSGLNAARYPRHTFPPLHRSSTRYSLRPMQPCTIPRTSISQKRAAVQAIIGGKGSARERRSTTMWST